MAFCMTFPKSESAAQGEGLDFVFLFPYNKAMMEQMIQKVGRFIRQQNLLEQGDQVAAGISGGADSVCLLFCLSGLSAKIGFTLTAVHVHHGLRGEEADGDEAFVKELCGRLGVPCMCSRVDVAALARERRISVEEAGRAARYEILRREAKGGKIAVAHHQSDQAETVLFHLLRGTGIKGAAGMAPRAGDVIRPLLFLSRREIEAFLRERGQAWREDGTNRDLYYTRNRIRNQLLPLAKEGVNARSEEHLAAFAGQARELDELLDRLAENFLTQCRSGENEIRLPQKELIKQPAVLGKRILLTAIGQVSGSRRDIGKAHLDAVWELLKKPVGSRIRLPGGFSARQEYEMLRIGREEEEHAAAALPAAKFRIIQQKDFPKIRENRYTKCFDYDKIKNSAILRFRQQGDYLELSGGGRKTLHRYMIDEKIPAPERGRIPVLADGSHILWVVGRRVSAFYQVTKDTQRILCVTVGGKEDGK